MKLSDLIKAVKPLSVERTGADKDLDPQIASVHYRSQEVRPGGLFVAIAGHTADGHDFIEDAIERGAAAIVSQKQIGCQIPHVRVADSRRALADIAACFYGNPSEHLTVIGITGTNGKTTTAYLVESILQQAGLAACRGAGLLRAAAGIRGSAASSSSSRGVSSGRRRGETRRRSPASAGTSRS